MNIKKRLVVKSNNLVSAVHSLTLTETRIVQMAIVAGRESGKDVCLSDSTPIRLYASEYAKVFDTTEKAGFMAMKEAQDNLFKREFTMRDENGDKTRWHWVQSIKPIEGEAAIEILFTKVVCQEVTRRLGDFTQYRLEQTAGLKGAYSVRLYELLSSWIRVGKFYIGLQEFRDWVGLTPEKYKLMHQFKTNVLDYAIDDINKNSDMSVSYTQRKAGRRIAGFDFKFSLKIPDQIQPPKKPKKPAPLAYGKQVIDHLNMTRDAAGLMASKMSFLSDTELPAELIKLPPPKRANAMLNKLCDPQSWQELMPQLKAAGYTDLLD